MLTKIDYAVLFLLCCTFVTKHLLTGIMATGFVFKKIGFLCI